MGKIITGYKGFERDFTCRGMQYEVGKTYVLGVEPKLCERGFHFCTSPLAVFKYYAPTNRFAIVKANVEDVIYDKTSNSYKAVARRITIVREITLDEIMCRHMEFSSRMNRSATGGEMCRLGYEKVLQEGCSLKVNGMASIVGVMGGTDYSVSVDGNYAASVETNTDRTVALCYGRQALAATTGCYSVARADGVCSVAVATQCSSVAISSVCGSAAVATDDDSIAVGKRGATAVCTGLSSAAISNGSSSLAVAAGERCSASGVIGSWLVLVQREFMHIRDVRVVRVDGKEIKEGVRYELIDGEIREV